MPTTRPRHLITETDAVAQALDDAAERWPEEADNRARLLVRLVQEGHHAIVHRHEDQVAARRAAIASTAGAFTGMYEPGYLAKLREDWPE